MEYGIVLRAESDATAKAEAKKDIQVKLERLAVISP
jgi:hypothetical protein